MICFKERLLLILLFSILSQPLIGQMTIHGTVYDASDKQPIISAVIEIEGNPLKVLSDNDGNFVFEDAPESGVIKFSCLGYESKIRNYGKRTKSLKVSLKPISYDLQEVVIISNKSKYSKKNNPTLDFIRATIAKRDVDNPYLKHDFIAYDKHVKTTIGIGGVDFKGRGTGHLQKYVDSVSFNQVHVLPISEEDRLEQELWQRAPFKAQKVVKALEHHGLDEFVSRDNMNMVMKEMFTPIDIFTNDIPFFMLRFVSPLSSLGPSFYKYFTVDTLEINSKQCLNIAFVPFNPESHGFVGNIFITTDSTKRVYKVKLQLPKQINLNYVKSFSSTQEFVYTENETREKIKDETLVVLKVPAISHNVYMRMQTFNHNFQYTKKPYFDQYLTKDELVILEYKEKPEQRYLLSESNDTFVGKNNVKSVKNMMEELRSNKLYYVTEKLIGFITSSYIPLASGKSSAKFFLGPIGTFITANDVEGLRLRVGGETTPNFNKRLFFEGFAAYGFKDDRAKYRFSTEYSFNEKKEFRKEFPVHSLRISAMYDTKQLGESRGYFGEKDVLKSFRRTKNELISYERSLELTYKKEYYNNFSFELICRNRKEEPGPYVDFRTIDRFGEIQHHNHYQMTEFEVGLRYAPGEKFYQNIANRYKMTWDKPEFRLNHRMAYKGFLNSDYDYQRTDFYFRQRFWLSFLGSLDVMAKTSKVWGKAPYPLLVFPDVNLSYLISTGASILLLPQEFILDEYYSCDLTYRLNGLLMNRIPLIKKLQLREVISFQGFYGSLSDKNNPAIDSSGLFLFPENTFSMGNKPYLEMGVGFENILKIFRVDYVWRLTYKNHPGVSINGFRFGAKLHF